MGFLASVQDVDYGLEGGNIAFCSSIESAFVILGTQICPWDFR